MFWILFRYKMQLLVVMASLCFVQANSQQVGISVSAISTSLKVSVRQEISFGAFAQGNAGGSVTISAEGTRWASGAVVPLNFGAAYLPLILEIEGPRGSIVSMLSDETTILTGSNGGTMKLKLIASNPAMPFIITEDAPAKSIVKIGAELIVGNAAMSPPGSYTGTLNLSFIVE